MQNSMPEYMLILTEAYSTFLDAINSSLMRGASAQTMDLPGAYILVDVFPYDAMLGSGTAAVDDEKRLDIFEKIADGQQFRYDEVTTQQINGLPALMAQSTKVLGRDTNQGTLLVIDAAPHFYAITIAGPQARWLTDYAPMADLVLDQLTVTPPVVTEEGNQVGQRAPDFTATLIDGSSVSLSDYRGKFVLLDFWATWCEPCREEIPSLQKAYEERDNLVVLAIDFLEDEGTVSAFARTNKITFPMALDLTGEVNYLYKVSGYPTNYLINKEGIIIDISLGGMPSLHQVK